MPWQDRIRPAAWTSPTGTRFEFQYENVRKEFTKHTTAFDFPDADGTFVQTQGRSGHRFPLRIIFNGDDYDLLAQDFDDALGEDGISQLEHPMYGPFKVVPFGRIARRDDLKSRANQAIFDVTFFETNELLFPANVLSPLDAATAAVEEALQVQPDTFVNAIDVDSTIVRVSLRDRFEAVVDQVESFLRPIADVQSDIATVQNDIGAAFATVFDAIKFAIDVFIGDPLALGFQVGILIQLPARSTALIADRLTAYGTLLQQLTTEGIIYLPSTDSQPENDFRNDDMFGSNLVLGSVTSVLNNEFTTKTDALLAAEQILGFSDAWVAWRDLNFVSLSLIDSGEVYQKVLDAVTIGAAFLVEISFSLKQERSLVLDVARTPLQLETQLYGTLDENLDFLISSNDLVGGELLSVPVGRTVVYYT